MMDYDFVLNEMGIMTGDVTEEKIRGSKVQEGHERQKLQARSVGHVQPSFGHGVYSDHPLYNDIVAEIQDLDTIPDPPASALNAFAITLFCMEAAFDSRSKDFLKYAFDRFPDRDYLIVTQPHTVAENSLLQKFTLVPKKAENTFTHVLYIVHRDALLEMDLYVERAVAADLERVKELVADLDEREAMLESFYDATVNPDSGYFGFVARIDEEVVGAFVLAKDVNLDYYKSHFHIQDSILLSEHERKAHTRLLHAVINPIFEKQTRYILKELLRLSANTCLYFEIHDKTVIPNIFHELIHLRSRRFPHFLDRKWDHERYVPEGTKDHEDRAIKADGHDRDPQDEQESPFALCFTTKRLLSEPKIIKNSRIVVVGASDTGISFIEALLSISYLNFTNITLIAPGGLPHHHFDEKLQNLKAYSTSYSQQELKRLMLETRVQVINARMVDIDRSDKNIILHDDSIIPYDTLVLAMGLQDKTLASLGYVSRGVVPLQHGKEQKPLQVQSVLSVDDPYLYQHMRPGGTLMNLLTNKLRPQNCVVYGHGLHAYCCVQGLLARGLKPEQITLVLPGIHCHVMDNYDSEEELLQDLPFINPPAFEDELIESKVHKMLEAKGVRIVRNAQLLELIANEENYLEFALFKLLDIPDEEEEEDEPEGMDQQSEHESRLDSMNGDGEGLDGDMDKSQ